VYPAVDSPRHGRGVRSGTRCVDAASRPAAVHPLWSVPYGALRAVARTPCTGARTFRSPRLAAALGVRDGGACDFDRGARWAARQHNARDRSTGQVHRTGPQDRVHRTGSAGRPRVAACARPCRFGSSAGLPNECVPLWRRDRRQGAAHERCVRSLARARVGAQRAVGTRRPAAPRCRMCIAMIRGGDCPRHGGGGWRHGSRVTKRERLLSGGPSRRAALDVAAMDVAMCRKRDLKLFLPRRSSGSLARRGATVRPGARVAASRYRSRAALGLPRGGRQSGGRSGPGRVRPRGPGRGTRSSDDRRGLGRYPQMGPSRTAGCKAAGTPRPPVLTPSGIHSGVRGRQ
jgi:hypothetical protein